MVYKSKELELATHYRKQGFSYSEIANLCGVSKGTISRWFAKKSFSQRVRKDNQERAARENAKRVALLQKARQAVQRKTYQESELSAKSEFSHHVSDPLFVSALMMYRTCGDRNSEGTIRLTSQDWLVHKHWQQFLAKYLGVSREKMRFYLTIYKNHDAKKVEKQWSKQLSFPVERFGKTQILNQQVQTLHNGTGSTIIGSTVLKHKLAVWLQLLEKQR